ncbi:hypothetical protein KJ966_24295 [bacterium]|nr:hypothetical protein [bacterium]
MQPLNLFLTKHNICYQSIDLSIDKTIFYFDDASSDPLVQLNDLISELNLPRSVTLNLILDHSFVGLYCFTLPPVSRRRIDKILGFELSDALLEDVDEYFFDYRHFTIKDKETRVSVYTVKKNIVNRIIQICRAQGLEIRSISSIVDLLNQKIKKKYAPDNDIVIVSDRFYTYLFTYKGSFLCGVSSLKVTEDKEKDSENLNTKLKSIGIQNNEINNIIIDDYINSEFELDDQNSIRILDHSLEKLPDSHFSQITEVPLITLANRINLLKSNFFLLKELKKHTGKIILSSFVIGVCVLIYISSIIYENIANNKKYKELEEQYNETINRYLPKGVSKSNAVYILQTQVNELKEQQKKNQRFKKREYTVSQQLSDLSALKKEVSSLILNRYFLTDQSIRIQGEVSSYGEYDRLKINLEDIYNGKEYSMKFNQKSIGEGLIQFSVTIRPIKDNN